ncbi:twin-arginine translocase TatA/TatE family subunit [Sulfurimonas lithotrophica]|uniref:Sec-independent protein translocase protein TatA n=1 Tax=Sulfurimonas lithotrophica TaxID=2590022 RepID=A0A5P8NYJ0_9BACT|nr:twin-arginine translocase TatA/TatE family subunit [Sulfurimonas lithotrophica]QFR48489.1 twin-arginine translocase TatA/TatE family subunit [Sulfurimonas lithotrophica]
MGMPSGTELLIIFGIIVLLFGAKKIPDLAKGLGKGIKNFKAEMKDDSTEVASNEPKKVEGSEEDSTSTEAPKNTTQA